MDSSALAWISEMGLESSIFMDQSEFMFMDMDSIDQDLAAILGQDLEPCLSHGNNNSSSVSSTLINIPSTNSITSLCPEPPAKLQKPNNFTDFSKIQNASHPDRAVPIILNFGNGNVPNIPNQGSSRPLNPDEEAAVTQVLKSQVSRVQKPDEQSKNAQTVKKASRIRPASQNYDHIIAERKRREQLSQRFIALSTIVPGLKKMDKTSVLGDAIKYLKHLQERVKILEEQQTKQTMESVVLVRKSQVMKENHECPSDDNACGSSDVEHPFPEIEARVCNNHVLVRIHCKRHRGVLVKLITKVESLNLTVINTYVTPFGTLAINITINAEIEKEFDLTVKQVVKKLRAVLRETE